MTALHITTHAIQRLQERYHNFPDAEAREFLSSPTIRKAAEFGAPYVKLGTGHRIVLSGFDVVTVLPAETPAWRLGCRKEQQ